MLTEAQCRRALRRAEIPWDVNLLDPRDPRGRRLDHYGLLATLVAAFATGKRTLRGAEELLEDVDPLVRRKLGLPTRASDTALYELLAGQSGEGLRETVQNQVDEWVEQKLITADMFPVGVVSFDGKNIWSSTTEGVEGARESVSDEAGSPVWTIGTFRAVFTASRVRPCLDLETIGSKEGESPAFRIVFPRVVREFDRLFEVVTADAGLTCRENAALVVEHNKNYLFGLKGNHPTLHEYAKGSLWLADVEAETTEQVNGKLVHRELRTLDVDADAVGFPGARQLWRIRQTTQTGSAPPVHEDRFFVTSLPTSRFSAKRKLDLVRLHWGIENGLHWTLDVVLGEDAAQPCQQSRTSIEVVAWLRVLAYNLLSAWRAQEPQKDGRPMPWRRAMERLRDAFVHANARALATLA